MVDDIVCVSTSDKTQIMNEVINTLIERKKLKLSKDKCFQLHIGKGHNNCPSLKVHDSVMKVADSEKYLGDTINKNALSSQP